ncbi:MAG TPA: hypothetical protein VFJ74_08090 [Gemmatimonadaceae bacterium]|nr:hypothetical protein [Gemmatimonadaceae bacterium]
MNLVHDVLDRVVVDRNECHVGRVDGLVLELRDGAPPRVAEIEIGAETAMRRVGGWLGRLAEALGRWTGDATRGPTRVPWQVVTVVGKYVALDVEAEDTDALALELWLREHVVAKVPLT